MTTFEIIVSGPAGEDLEELARWITAEADSDVAKRYLHRLTLKISTLTNNPERGSRRPDVGEGVLAIVFERKRLIYYRVVGDTVQIERVVHGRRNQLRAFRNKPERR